MKAQTQHIDMSNHLPDDVALKLLQRLPVKSVIRFRCVSKSWNSLITSPYLITSHLTRSLSNSSDKLIVRHRTFHTNIEHYKVIHENNDSFYQQLDHCPRIPNFYFTGSVNGLLCFYSNIDRIILWNPSIRNFFTLPKPPINFYSTFCRCHDGFGFDPVTNDYKVMTVTYHYSNDEPKEEERVRLVQVQVYSLNEGSWRILTSAAASFPPWITFSRYGSSGGRATSFNGALHFAARHKDFTNSVSVLSFDFGDAVFRVSMPLNLVKVIGRKISTFVFRESLSLLCYDTYNNRCSIWIMKEYGVVDSWTKHIIFELGGITRVLGVRRNGHLLVEEIVDETPNLDSSKLYSYDPETQQGTNLNLLIWGKQNSFYVDDYMENLVLLNKPTTRVVVVSKKSKERKSGR